MTAAYLTLGEGSLFAGPAARVESGLLSFARVILACCSSVIVNASAQGLDAVPSPLLVFLANRKQ